MNKEQFLAALRARLTGLPKEDLERTLQYYREMIDDRIEDGMTEFEAVADVGDPDELAEAILQKPVRGTSVRIPTPTTEKKTMSRGTRAALIVVAALLVAAGLSLILASLNARKDAVIKDFAFGSAEIRSLEIDAGAAEVKLFPGPGGACRIQCIQSSTLKYTVWCNDGTLHIERHRTGKWALFHFSLEEDYIHVYLPQGEYEHLRVKTTSGGVAVPEDFRFRTAIISASSGGIGFSADVAEKLDLQTTSGGVAVFGASPKELRVSVSSGGAALGEMNPGSVFLHVTSGGMRLSDVNCTELTAESSSGGIRFSDVIASGKMTLECTSGSIKLDDCDAAELHIKCTSGSVSGHLLTPKIYTASAGSGSVSVPFSESGGICDVKTTSGSIRFD